MAEWDVCLFCLKAAKATLDKIVADVQAAIDAKKGR